MARPRKAEINSDNRREELIIAAARLFSEKGYHGTSMRDVAAAINMQPGSPFYHFASKQELLLAGAQRGLTVCLDALEAINARDMRAVDYFRALAHTHIEHLLSDRIGVVPLVVSEWQHLDEVHRATIVALRRRYEALWLSAFERLKGDGAIMRADKLACWYFLGALHSIREWYKPEGELSLQEIADSLVDWILDGKA
jgi:AcrR family transcriptional regulator